MALIWIRGNRVDVDIEKELSMFTWKRAKWTGDRLIACSPFRYDSRPSFYVYLVDTPTAPAGSWGDSGGSGEYRKGGFVKLLAFLRGETEEETENYLLSEYAREVTEDDPLKIDFSNLRIEAKRIEGIPESFLEQFEPPNDYLRLRGISDRVLSEVGVKYDPKRNAVVIPWRFPDGRLANIKYRQCDSKIFYYSKNGVPVRELVWGLDRIHKKGIKRAVLVEAEIDAMYIESVTEFSAIALGTCTVTREKAELIARSPLEEIIVVGDNDEAGRKMERQTIELLSPFVRIKRGALPQRAKDPNDLTTIELSRILEGASTVLSMISSNL